MERLKGFRQELRNDMGRMYLELGGLSNPEKVAVVAPIALQDVAIRASHELGTAGLAEIDRVVDEVVRRRTLIYCTLHI